TMRCFLRLRANQDGERHDASGVGCGVVTKLRRAGSPLALVTEPARQRHARTDRATVIGAGVAGHCNTVGLHGNRPWRRVSVLGQIDDGVDAADTVSHAPRRRVNENPRTLTFPELAAYTLKSLSEASSPLKRSFAVTIAGQRYTIKSDAEEAYVIALADLVD